MHFKSYFPYSMKDLNGDSSWPLLYGDKMVTNGQCYNGFMPRTLGYPGHDKDTLKQKMLEHEAVFKNQVLELHRLYRIQRDIMEEFKRKDRASMEPASSSSLQEPRKWHMAGFPLSNSSCGRTPDAGVENLNSPASCTKGNNGYTGKYSKALDSRPLKVRKKLFDLQLAADEYEDPQEEEKSSGNPTNGPESGMNCFIGHTGTKTDRVNDACGSAGLRGSVGLADLNEPIHIEEAVAPSSIDFLSHISRNGVTNTIHRHVTGESGHVLDGISMNSSFESRVTDMRWLSHANVAGSYKGSISSMMQGSQQEKPSLSSCQGQGAINHVHYPYSNGYNREEKWREGFGHGLESASRCYSSSNSGSHPFFTSSSFATSRFHSMSSWPHPSSGFTQKITALESNGNPIAMSRLLQPSSSPCQQSLKGSWLVDSSSRPGVDINLNEALPMAEGESRANETLPSLHWLRPKSMHADEATDESSYRHASSNGSYCKNGSIRDIEISRKEETVKKILGFPIRERDVSVDRCDEQRNGLIDINVACEPDEELTTENDNKKKGSPRKDQFDLNSCVSDSEEDPSPPFYEQNGSRSFQIDLEAPLLLESDDEAFSEAAETLVAISLSPLANRENTLNSLSLPCEGLLFLANAISLDQNEVALDSSDQLDEFEAMTLKLAEAIEEDCKAKPFLPELQMLEEGEGQLVHTRRRRGHARRGRQLRDFQKDILPGLASLSRQEVSEDIQIFGGLMRATGHAWNSGLTRRNGTMKGGRGRRRVVAETTPVCIPLMEKLSSIGGGLEERSLKGWGKTTRRPRRQRCPAGSVATAVLTR